MKTALITGGSRGIGAATVRAFAKAGYQVVFLYYQSKESALLLANETGATALCCDIADRRQMDEACVQALRQLTHLDAFVHCAGIAQQKLITDVTDEDWRRMFAIHVDSAFFAARAVLPGMIAKKCGQIVFLSSIWGQVGASMEVPYSAAKAALIGLTRALAKEVAPCGIRVNCVAPGVIATDMLSALSPDTLAQLAEETPLGRIGTSGEVAKSILWLCSDDAAFLTGQVLSLNGGMVMA